MDKNTAKKVLETANDCANDLGSLVQLLKKNCDNDVEYQEYGKKIGKVVAYIIYDIEKPFYELYPELKKEIKSAQSFDD